MDRTKFYMVEDVDGKQEMDFLQNNINKFAMKYQPLYYMVNEEELMRPDLISYRNYGTVRYWWLLMVVNGIFDPLTQLKVGQRLVIPNILDIYEFYKKYVVR